VNSEKEGHNETNYRCHYPAWLKILVTFIPKLWLTW
jgi:hypothetical protein